MTSGCFVLPRPYQLPSRRIVAFTLRRCNLTRHRLPASPSASPTARGRLGRGFPWHASRSGEILSDLADAARHAVGRTPGDVDDVMSNRQRGGLGTAKCL